MTHAWSHVAVMVGITVMGQASAATAQQWVSPAEARTLVAAMQARHAEAIAAQDATDASRFVAALLLPGQLLVVSGTHPQPNVVKATLQAGDFRGVYMDLQGSPDTDGRFFVHDLNADGLSIAPKGEPFDNIYAGSTSLSCDGQWKSAKLDEAEYRRRVGDADARYAELLRVLAQTLQPQAKR